VDNTLLVAVLHCREHLFYNRGCILLSEKAPVCDLVEEFSSSAEFGDKVVSLLILKDFVKSHYVRMIELPQDLNLLEKSLLLLRVKRVLANDFDSSDGSCFSVGAFPNFTKCTYRL
jgi:hypothetical protein